MLDVGCGVTPKGDVNCDISILDDGSRSGSTDKPKRNINSCKVPNFIICSAEFLPFKKASFTQVISCHVIEHTNNPNNVLAELIRVCSGNVDIYCPHRLGDRIWANLYLFKNKVPFHKWFFNIQWFGLALKKYNLPFSSACSKYLCLPCEYVPLIRLPLEIHIHIKVGDNY